jgi:hypothetical protein
VRSPIGHAETRPTCVQLPPPRYKYELHIRGATGRWVVWDYAETIEEALALVETALKHGEAVQVEHCNEYLATGDTRAALSRNAPLPGGGNQEARATARQEHYRQQ